MNTLGGSTQRSEGAQDPSDLPLEDFTSTSATIEILLDTGRRQSFQAWRSRCDGRFTRTLGIAHLSRGLCLAEIERRAIGLMQQAALLHLPYGGACGGVDAEAGALSPGELHRLVRSFLRAFPDMALTARGDGTDTALSAWLSADQRMLRPCAGMPAHGRMPAIEWAEAIAMGASALLHTVAPRPGTWVLHGFDRSALILARRMAADGWKLVAVSDGHVAVDNPVGIAISELACAMVTRKGLLSLVGERGTNAASHPFTMPADLVVVAGQGRLTAELGATLNCRAVMDLSATDGVCATLETQLAQRGVAVVPAIVATAGATILAHLCWLQRRHGYVWDTRELARRLMLRMSELTALPAAHMRREAVARATHFIRSAGATIRAL